MVRRLPLRPGLPTASAIASLLSIALAGCAPVVRGQAVAAPASPEPVGTQVAADNPNLPPPQPVDDPITVLIAESERHFEAGQRELSDGHLQAAREEFNRAVDVLIESRYGGRTEPRIREQFDRLVDRVSAIEIRALADGDGFTEKSYDTASIDDLLALSSTFGETVPPPELNDVVRMDLKATPHDIDIPLNTKVLSYVQLFQGRLHDFMAEGLDRGARYLPMIQRVFKREGLPLDLAYVPLVESAFKPNARSRARAQGMWQFMSGTAGENGLRYNWFVDERSDPEKATEAAAKYLRELADEFDGDWHLALASYNGGPGRVERAMARGRSDDFWKLSATSRYLPRETREYVPMVLAAMVIGRHPAQYGFQVSPQPLPAVDAVTLSKPVDLRRIAEWTGTTIDEIQDLNPELTRWTTPVREDDYTLKVPAGSGDLVRVRILESGEQDLASLQWYSVRKGETLTSIARKLKVSRTDLAQANDLRTSSRLSVGQQLIVPVAATALMAARTEREAPLLEAKANEIAPALSARTATAGNRIKTTYQVRRGDTLYRIARLFETTVQSVKRWNGLSGDDIKAGDRLTVYKLAN
jgi:membrane-bound lytic murein transglycosylase D